MAGLSSHARQKKWSGHGRTGRTADDGLAESRDVDSHISGIYRK